MENLTGNSNLETQTGSVEIVNVTNEGVQSASHDPTSYPSPICLPLVLGGAGEEELVHDASLTQISAPLECYQLGAETVFLSVSETAPIPSGIFLPGTELLQSPFRREFSNGSRSRRYRRFLRRHRRFLRSYRRLLRSYRRSLRRSVAPRAPMRRRRSLRDSLNIIKDC